MKCSLCNEPIEKYNAQFHHLKINDARSVDICPECLDRIILWQSKIASRLFPTKVLKKRWKNK